MVRARVVGSRGAALLACGLLGCASPAFDVGASVDDVGGEGGSIDAPTDAALPDTEGPRPDAAAPSDAASDVGPDVGPPGCTGALPVVSCAPGPATKVLERPGTGAGLPLLAEKTAHRLEFTLATAGRVDAVTVRFLNKSAATAFGGPDGVVTADVFYLCGDAVTVPVGTVSLDGAIVGTTATFALPTAPALPAGARVAVVLSTTSKAWVWELAASAATGEPTWAVRAGATAWAPATKIGDVSVGAHGCAP